MMQYLRKNYRFGLDKWGAALFLAVMLPNFFWFAVPAPSDILRAPSLSGGLDAVAGMCQIWMAAALAGVVNRRAPAQRGLRLLPAAALGSLACYYGAWAVYYQGVAAPAVILALAGFPCAAFLLYEASRKNGIALVPTAIFKICHLISSATNFII